MAELQTEAEHFTAENRFGLSPRHKYWRFWTHIWCTHCWCESTLLSLWVGGAENKASEIQKKQGLISKSEWRSSKLKLNTSQLKTRLDCHQDTNIEDSGADIWCIHCWCESPCCLCVGGAENKASEIQNKQGLTANLNGRAPDWSLRVHSWRQVYIVTKTHILKSLWLIFGVLTAGVCHHVVFVVWEVQKTRPPNKQGLISKSEWQSSRLELKTAQLKTGLYCHQNTYNEESGAHIWCVHCWCVSSCCLCVWDVHPSQSWPGLCLRFSCRRTCNLDCMRYLNAIDCT